MDNNNQRKRIVLGVMLVAVVVVTLAGTFAYFVSQTQSTEAKLTVTTGTLALTFSDNNTGITASSLSFGQSTTKQFKIENTGTLDVTTNMLWNNLVNTYTEGSLTYKFEYRTTETEPWTLVPNASGNIPQSETAIDKNLATELTIPAKTTYYYQLTITLNHLADVDQTVDKDAVLNSNFKLGDKIIEVVSIPKMVKAIINNKTVPYVKSENPDFSNVATTDETAYGLYFLEDDYGTSYYYRGAVENNYVKFGRWATGTPNAGKDMWWRIIRVNGDGSLRMIYDGTQAFTNGINNNERFAYIKKEYNSNYNDNAYEGWMYGITGGTKEQAQTNTTNSTLKNLVNSWYDQNLVSYDAYIADAIYCNDRSIPGKSVTGWSEDTGLGYAKNPTAYGAAGRLIDASTGTWLSRTNPTPKFVCPQKNDAFTVSDSVHGNAIGPEKSRKIGLITADEVIAAGGVYALNNKDYYLYKSSGYHYWTMSPNFMDADGWVKVFILSTAGNLHNGYWVGYSDNGAVAPVISIKAEYAAKLTGSGIASDPYTIPNVA